MSATVIQFPARRRAIVFIDPVDDDGGSWGVFHQRPEQEPYRVATRFAFDRAEDAARQLAQQLDADFLDDVAPGPKGAA